MEFQFLLEQQKRQLVLFLCALCKILSVFVLKILKKLFYILPPFVVSVPLQWELKIKSSVYFLMLHLELMCLHIYMYTMKDIRPHQQLTEELAHTSMPKWQWDTILDPWMGETRHLFRVSPQATWLFWSSPQPKAESQPPPSSYQCRYIKFWEMLFTYFNIKNWISQGFT